MRPSGRGFLKGRNKWVRPADSTEAPGAAPAVPPATAAPPGPVPPATKPLRRLGKHALVRDTPPPKKPSKPPLPAINKSRFKYVRPQNAAGPAAATPAAPAPRKPPPPPPLAARKPPAASKPPPPQQASKPAAAVRPGKLRWNKYVRGEGGDVSSAAGEKSADRHHPVEPRRASKRVAAAAAATEHRRSVTQRALRATKLLRLGGQLYSVGGKGGKKNRSLQLRAVPGPAAPGTAAAAKPAKPPTKPPIAAKPAAPPSPARPMAPPPQTKQLKPSARLKGGRLLYCPVYCHTGKCPRRGRGCPLRHDPTKRAVCGMWLRGACPAGRTCALQHQRRLELMPACVHFLAGRCNAGDACPFLHQHNVCHDAPPCAAFLKGYCAAGAACASRHLTLKQVKEERRLVAGDGRKKRKTRREPETEGAKDAPAAAAGEGEGEGRQRKRRRSRYFDDMWSMGAGAGEEVEAIEEESSSAEGPSDSDSDSGDEFDGEPLSARPSSGPQDFIGF
jgi:hypothetical protein